jgi:hypothetical protein
VNDKLTPEPSIADLLSEPIIQALMKVDGVTVDQIKDILAQARPAAGAARDAADDSDGVGEVRPEPHERDYGG